MLKDKCPNKQKIEHVRGAWAWVAILKTKYLRKQVSAHRFTDKPF